MFYRYGGSFIGTMSDTNKWVKMYQSPELEFVVNQDCWFGGEARFADIILPACTNFEREDIGEWATCGGYTTNAHIGNNWRVVVRQKKCIEPLGESKSDYEIFRLLAQRLGFEEEFTEGNTELDWARKFFETSDICKDGDVTWEEFNERGYYLIPVRKTESPRPACAGLPRAASATLPIPETASVWPVSQRNLEPIQERLSLPLFPSGRTCPTIRKGP